MQQAQYSAQEENKVLARLIIEMIGKPADRVSRVLKEYVEKLKTDGLKVVYEDYAKPAEIKGGFSVFVEFEAWFKDIISLVAFCFDAMPSSVDIVQPTNISFNAKEFSDLLNDMQAKLHNVDMAIKNLKAQNQRLNSNSLNVLRNFIVYIVKDKERSLDEIAKALGLTAKEAGPFLDRLVDTNDLEKKGDTYGVVRGSEEKS